MYRDALGDPWYYADIDPPEHLEAGRHVTDGIVWVDVRSMTMWEKKRGKDWRVVNPDDLAPPFREDYERGLEIRSVMGL